MHAAELVSISKLGTEGVYSTVHYIMKGNKSLVGTEVCVLMCRDYN